MEFIYAAIWASGFMIGALISSIVLLFLDLNKKYYFPVPRFNESTMRNKTLTK